MGQKESRLRTKQISTAITIPGTFAIGARNAFTTLPKGIPVNLIIETLPVELFLQITKYLYPKDLLCLNYTCRGLAQFLATSIPNLVEFLSQRERLEILFQLDRDHLWRGKRACGACFTVHNKECFSKESLAKWDVTRQFLGSEMRVWICPHVQFSHHRITSILNTSPAWRLFSEDKPRLGLGGIGGKDGFCEAWKRRLTSSEAEEENRTTWLIKRRIEEEKNIKLFMRQASRYRPGDIDQTEEEKQRCDRCQGVTFSTWARSSVKLEIAILPNEDGLWRVPSEKEVKKRMRSTQARMCPHLNLSDPCIMGAYSEICKAIGRKAPQNACSCRVCVAPQHGCSHCHAKFRFEIEDRYNHTSRLRSLCVVIERKFDPTIGITNPAWIAQLVREAMFDELRDFWYRTADQEYYC